MTDSEAESDVKKGIIDNHHLGGAQMNSEKRKRFFVTFELKKYLSVFLKNRFSFCACHIMTVTHKSYRIKFYGIALMISQIYVSKRR